MGPSGETSVASAFCRQVIFGVLEKMYHSVTLASGFFANLFLGLDFCICS